MVVIPFAFRGAYIVPQKVLGFTDNYANTRGKQPKNTKAMTELIRSPYIHFMALTAAEKAEMAHIPFGMNLDKAKQARKVDLEHGEAIFSCLDNLLHPWEHKRTDTMKAIRMEAKNCRQSR